VLYFSYSSQNRAKGSNSAKLASLLSAFSYTTLVDLIPVMGIGMLNHFSAIDAYIYIYIEKNINKTTFLSFFSPTTIKNMEGQPEQ